MVDRNWTPWIIAGVVVLAVILIAFFMSKSRGPSNAEYLALVKSCSTSDANLQSCCQIGGSLYNLTGSGSNVPMNEAERICACKAGTCAISPTLGLSKPPVCNDFNPNITQAWKDCGLTS